MQTSSDSHPNLIFLVCRPPPRSPLFPYTTLFRSQSARMAAPTSAHPCPKPRATACRFSRSTGRAREPARGSSRLRARMRSEEHTSELQSRLHLVCRLLLEKKKRFDLLNIPDNCIY